MMETLLRFALGGLALAALGGFGGLIRAARVPLGGTDGAPAPEAVAASTAAATIPADDSTVGASGLFRPGRVPAPIPFDPLGSQAPPPAEPVPTLVLVGLVLSGTPAAVIRGIPGQDGAHVMAEGEERGGVRVARIRGTGVTVTWRSDTLHITLAGEAR